MKTVLKFLSVVVLSLACGVAFAQDAANSSPVIGSIFSKVPGWVVPSVLGLYEILVRIIPTAKNWSILSAAIKLIQFILPNNSSVMQTKNPNTHE